MTYHDLSEALVKAGCAICQLVANSVDCYLRGLLHESVNDPGMRERLRASKGFCREHSWQLQRRGDPLSISILWHDLLSPELDEDPGRRRRAGGRRKPLCPACEIAVEAERRYVGILVEHLEVGALRNEYAASAGLCLPHLGLARIAAPAGARCFLATAESDKLTRLREELSEIIRKNDHRFRDEPWGSERDAWIRATRKLAGEPPEG